MDDELTELLGMFGAVSIGGPKYCGKSWTDLNHASSSVLLTRSDGPSDVIVCGGVAGKFAD